MTPPNSIAVIITAFNRRNYYAEAVESALRAASGPGPVEYLLLRNFEDPEGDPRWTERGVRLVPDHSPDVGGTIYSALDQSDAEYLAFVDDDDLVLPHHLQRFFRIRELVPDVQYYHNGYATFSTAEASPPTPSALSSVRAPEREATWSVFRATDGERFLRFLARTNRERNLSSTILHRSALERARPDLSKVVSMSDTAALVAGLTSGGPLVFDDEVTTLVRRHPENVSKTPRHNLARSADFEQFSRTVDRSPNAGIARDYLELRRAREVVYNRVFGVPSSSSETRAAVRELLDSWRRLHAWRDIGFLGMGGVALTVPAMLPALRALLVPN